MSYPPAPPPPPPPQQPPPGYGAPQYGGGQYGPAPNNWLVPAILATIFCCLPGGIVGIVYAAQVNSKWQTGDIAGAQNSAKNAKLWSLISIGAGLVALVIWFIFVFVLAAGTAVHHGT